MLDKYKKKKLIEEFVKEKTRIFLLAKKYNTTMPAVRSILVHNIGSTLYQEIRNEQKEINKKEAEEAKRWRYINDDKYRNDIINRARNRYYLKKYGKHYTPRKSIK